MTTIADDRRTVELRRQRAGLLFAAVASASFGLSGSLADGLMATGWTPAALVTARVVIGAVVLSVPALMALRGRWHLVRSNARLIAAYGLVPVAGCQLAYFSAVERLPVAVALLIEYTAPVALIGWIWAARGQRPARLTVAGAAVCTIGLVLVLDVFSSAGVDGLGVAWALGAMVGVAVFFVLSESDAHGLPPIVLATGGLIVGSVVLAAAGALGVVPMSASTAQVSYSGLQTPWWVPVLALGVVTAALAYVVSILATRRLGARLSSFASLMEVLFAVLFAWLLLDQLPHAIQLMGGVLVVAGVIVVRAGEPRI
jgi:drug/metabolite transporter (DMT)-like permease